MYLYFHFKFKYAVFIYFQNGNSCNLFLNTATFAFNFICKYKSYLKKNFLQKPQFTGVGGYTYMNL